MYSQQSVYLWKAHEDSFLCVAESVYAEHKDEPETVQHVAEYVAEGLGNYQRGIEMLAACLDDGMLSEDEQLKLVLWLHLADQFDESVPILQKMVQRWPDNLDPHVSDAGVLSDGSQSPELLGLLERTESRWREQKWWNEVVLAALVQTCLECGLYEQSGDVLL